MLAAGIAVGAAAAVAGTLFYFGRILISREEITAGRSLVEPEDVPRTPPERQIPSHRTRRS
jgi:hypothetical protein